MGGEWCGTGVVGADMEVHRGELPGVLSLGALELEGDVLPYAAEYSMPEHDPAAAEPLLLQRLLHLLLPPLLLLLRLSLSSGMSLCAIRNITSPTKIYTEKKMPDVPHMSRGK